MWGAGCVSAEAGKADQREGVKAAEPLGGFPRGQVWGLREGGGCIQFKFLAF